MRFLDIIKHNARPLMMLMAMSGGVILYRPISHIDSMTDYTTAPILIFLMLFVTFCRVHLRELRFERIHLLLILFQLVATPLSYYLFLPLGEVVAQGAMICFLSPIAMGAVAIGALLGARVETIVGYTLICNIVMAFVAPIFLDVFGNGECTFSQILSRVVPLLLAPLVLAQLLKLLWARAARWIAQHSQMSFYMWLCSMCVTLARTTDFVVAMSSDMMFSTAVMLSLVALLACVVQYSMGRLLGWRCGDKLSGAQSLGQKNTVLSVWLSQSFLFPISSIAPTAYIIWQNLVNSFQIYLYDRGERRRKRR